jgi:hypothetical protein
VRRLLALIAAVAMIVAALLLRERLDEDGGTDGSGGGPLRLVCAIELADACSDLDAEVVEEAAPITAERLGASSGADPGLDAWLVPDPWPAIVDDERGRAGRRALFPRNLPPLARSRLVLLADADLEGITWEEIGEQVGDGELRLGWRSPAESSVGLLTVGAAAAGWFGGPDFARNDFDEPGFDGWLQGLTDEARVSPSPVSSALVNPAEFRSAVSWDADAERELDGADPDRVGGRSVLYPDPVATIDVVLAPTSGAGESRVAEPIEEALLDAGWQAPDDDDLPPSNGLPRPGVLVALQEEVAA